MISPHTAFNDALEDKTENMAGFGSLPVRNVIHNIYAMRKDFMVLWKNASICTARIFDMYSFGSLDVYDGLLN